MNYNDSYNYIAINLYNPNAIKIGETSRLEKRKKELLKEKFLIVKTYDKTKNRPQRLLIESGLRITILEYENTRIVKDDYFITTVDNIMNIIENFELYCDGWLNNRPSQY